jgi:arabinogalactan oligomer/maltooligosaccharide transport system substrate-binding protein
VALSTAAASSKALTLIDLDGCEPRSGRDQDRQRWAAANGATVKVVSKDFGSIRSNLGTVAAADAPDVVLAAHDWTGELAANGLVAAALSVRCGQGAVPEVHARRVLVRHRDQEALRNPGAGREHRPAREHEARPEGAATFNALEASALSFKKKNKLAFGICVQQGSGGDAYHMYPFFAGLGGYVFGVNRAGNLDPSDIGVANPLFLKNARIIDRWNKEGLINSKTDYSTCNSAFQKGRPPTG